MTSETKEKLLKSKQVIEEINRHRWIESEKNGYDIGFEQASTDWLERFSKAWMQYHMPKRKKTPTATTKSVKKRKPATRASSAKSKKRGKSKTSKS